MLMKPDVGNPLQISDTSGSPVFIKECKKDVLHGFHGNGENGAWCTEFETEVDGKRYMCEVLQLVQSQKEWIQKKVTAWTGRKTLRDACSTNGYREDSEPYKVTQYGCRTDASRVQHDEEKRTLQKCSGGSGGSGGGEGSGAVQQHGSNVVQNCECQVKFKNTPLIIDVTDVNIYHMVLKAYKSVDH